MLAKALLFLVSFLPVAMSQVVEEYEVIMIAAHQSQCTRGQSKCVREIESYVDEYFAPFDEANGLRRDLWVCNSAGKCEASAPDFYLCVFHKGCPNQLRGRRTEQEDANVLAPPIDADCYLAGQLEDEAFKRSIVEDLGDECPCVQETNFYVRVCEYPETI